MKVQIKVITHIAHEDEVIDALVFGGFPIVQCSYYKPIKGRCILVEHPGIPYSISQETFKGWVLRWLKHRLGDDLFFVVMGA